MAKLVQIIGTHHNPLLPRRFERAEDHLGILEGRSWFDDMRRRLDAARPDLLLAIASDHLNQFFMDNMPPILVGKAERSQGPFPYEMRQYGIGAYDAPGAPDAARQIIELSFEHGLDVSFSDEYVMDHAFIIPLMYVRPEADLPTIPVFTNVMAPPLPPPGRFYEYGLRLRRVIDGMPGAARVGVVSSGHLSVEIGGPKPPGGAFDKDFDAQVVRLIGAGDPEGLLQFATMERMMEAGNFTPAFLNHVLLLGLAQGVAPDHAGLVFTDTSTLPFFSWDLDKGLAQ